MNLREVDLRKIYRVWKSNLGPFKSFFRSTSFVSLQTYDDFIIDEEIEDKNSYSLNTVLRETNKNNFIIVDLELNEILNLALKLNNEHKIKPVLNLNLLFHPFGLVGSKENINKIIKYGLELDNIKPESYVMLIPYDRYDEKIDYKKEYDKLNNQYAVGDDDMISIEFLKKLGYTGISVITKESVKEDLNDYIKYVSEEFSVNLIKIKE